MLPFYLQLRPPLAFPQRLAPPAACLTDESQQPQSSSPCSGPLLLLGLLPPSGLLPAPTFQPCDPQPQFHLWTFGLRIRTQFPCQVGTQLSVLICLRKDLYLGSALKLTPSLSPVAGHRWPGPVPVKGECSVAQAPHPDLQKCLLTCLQLLVLATARETLPSENEHLTPLLAIPWWLPLPSGPIPVPLHTALPDLTQ